MKRRVLAALAALSLLMAGCNGQSTGPAEVARAPITGVETAVAVQRSVPERVEAAATIKAASTGVVSAKVMGTVTSIAVREGERVRKGQTLLTIDDSDISQRAAAAEAGVKEAQAALEAAVKRRELSDATFERYQRLFEAKAVTRQEFDAVALQKEQARLDVTARQEGLVRARAVSGEASVYKGYAKVVAPFAGVVAEKKIDEGSMAAPGAPLIVIEDDSSFTLEASLDESLAGAVKKGVHVRAATDDGRWREARVIEVEPTIDPATRTFRVKAAISGEGLRSGAFARVVVDGAAKKALMVPSAAVVGKGQLTGVYVADETGVVAYRLVRTGSSFGDEVEVLSGLSAGERVISKGAERATDGGRIGAPR